MKRWNALLRSIGDQVRNQLRQGVEVKSLALAFALAAVFGIFPLMGFSTLACLAAGVLLKLNQPFIQTVNYLAAPFQLLMMPVFLRLGEWFFAQPVVSFSPRLMSQEFFASPSEFFSKYGRSGLFAALAWCLLSPFIGLLLYFVSERIFRGFAQSLKRGEK